MHPGLLEIPQSLMKPIQNIEIEPELFGFSMKEGGPLPLELIWFAGIAVLVEYLMRIKKPDLLMLRASANISLCANVPNLELQAWPCLPSQPQPNLWRPNRGLEVGSRHARQINTCGVENYMSALQLFWCNAW